ncbi:hypothetical protein Gpo141_00002024 [Globisporangium polare]
MDAVETQRFADEFRHVTLAHERLLLCVCGCGGDDATLVADALKKIVRIKLQMNTEHQISIARFYDSEMTVLQESPPMSFAQSEPSTAFLSHPRFHLDAIYWHTGISSEEAQSTFDQLCTFENANPFAKSYFPEVGGSIERLFQTLALILSHPAHRLNQVAAEDLLESPSLAR